MRKPKLAVIGAGVMGSQHARVVAASDDADLRVVIDRDTDRASALASRYGCKGANHHAAALLCDAAIVATATDHHLEVARDLIESGIPVLIEKPLASNLADVTSLVSLAAAKSVPITCGLVERHNPAVRTALEQLDGPVRHMVALRHSPPAGRAMSTIVWDLLIHDIDLAIMFADQSSFEVVGFTPSASEMTDEVDCLLRSANGARVNLSASRVSQRKIRTWHITCDDLAIELDLVRQNVTTYRHRSHEVGPGMAYRSETAIDIPYVRHGGEPLELQLRHFLRLVDGRVDAELERASLLPAHQLAAIVAADLSIRSMRGTTRARQRV